MKYCQNCGAEVEDGATTCPTCNTPVNGASSKAAYDHTAEFDAEDIASNKIFAVLGYILGFVGMAIALLGAKESPYVMFHVKQALKIEVSAIIALVLSSVLCMTCIVPVAGVIFILILSVLEIIAAVQVFMGLAKEPWLVRSLKFLGK